MTDSKAMLDDEMLNDVVGGTGCKVYHVETLADGNKVFQSFEFKGDVALNDVVTFFQGHKSFDHCSMEFYTRSLTLQAGAKENDYRQKLSKRGYIEI